MNRSSRKAYPRFKPVQTENSVLVYEFERFRYHLNHTRFMGASSVFVPNNAERENPNEYALKFFWSEEEANNSYERQRLAAQAGLAPPVGKKILAKSKNHKVRLWGYQTGYANTYNIGNGYENQVRKICRDLKIKLKMISAPNSDLPNNYKTKGKCVLGGDLHQDNIAVWNGAYVCIDFGHHSLIKPCGRNLRNKNRVKLRSGRIVYDFA
jgi:hypothetical protein